jgi:hypothetical protein
MRSMLRPPEPEPLPEGYLSAHFTLAELTYSDIASAAHIDNTPDRAAVGQLTQLAQLTLEGIRTICGDNPIFISSGYRCPELNKTVGGASNSAHLYGCAADFIIPDFGDVLDICHALEPHLRELGIDQLVNESGSGARWVHVGRAIPPSTAPRHQCLTHRRWRDDYWLRLSAGARGASRQQRSAGLMRRAFYLRLNVCG